MSKPQSLDRLSLLREALCILDGEAPDELVVEGDGWSLVDPSSVAREQALRETTVVSVPVQLTAVAVIARTTTSLLGAMGTALDEAISDGWCLSEEPASRDANRPAEPAAVLPFEPAPLANQPADTAQDQAIVAAGESMASALHEVGGLPDYEEQSPAFWRRFWAKSA